MFIGNKGCLYSQELYDIALLIARFVGVLHILFEQDTNKHIQRKQHMLFLFILNSFIDVIV
jgi:hypothetical protein